MNNVKSQVFKPLIISMMVFFCSLLIATNNHYSQRAVYTFSVLTKYDHTNFEALEIPWHSAFTGLNQKIQDTYQKLEQDCDIPARLTRASSLRVTKNIENIREIKLGPLPSINSPQVKCAERVVAGLARTELTKIYQEKCVNVKEVIEQYKKLDLIIVPNKPPLEISAIFECDNIPLQTNSFETHYESTEERRLLIFPILAGSVSLAAIAFIFTFIIKPPTTIPTNRKKTTNN